MTLQGREWASCRALPGDFEPGQKGSRQAGPQARRPPRHAVPPVGDVLKRRIRGAQPREPVLAGHVEHEERVGGVLVHNRSLSSFGAHRTRRHDGSPLAGTTVEVVGASQGSLTDATGDYHGQGVNS